ncbi:DUF6876 family protein [Leptolyngbya sp. PL-A3]|uniref:DUF6876 family protein n=1 Tax=Leptolyngbya sp. PL-A3 TaxID=2933911 RepID=UPI003299ECF5
MTNRNEKTTLTDADLHRFTGTAHYWRTGSPLHPFVYTDGVRYVLENGGVYWLLDIIGEWQRARSVRSNTALQQLQFWTLTVKADHSAEVICELDKGKVVVRQKILYTDFPLPKIEFYLEHMWAFWATTTPLRTRPQDNGVLLLPSEY